MKRNRLKFLKNPEFAQLATDVECHIESWLTTSSPADTAGLLDEVCQGVLTHVFAQIGGSEGTVWLVNSKGTALVAVYNTGPNSDSIVGFEQPVGSGIISMVYAQEQPYCENEISPAAGHDDTLDRQICQATRAMVAIPFYFAFGLRGVISSVQLQNPGEPDPGGFESSDVEFLVKAGNSVERLFNERLLSVVLGFDEG